MFYCAKCNADNEAAVCAVCGKKLAAGTARVRWTYIRTPVLDSASWSAALLCIAAVLVLALVLLSGAEYFIGQMPALNRLFTGPVPLVLCALACAGVLLVLFTLLLQGKERVDYVLDTQGAHMQVWVPCSRVKFLARFQGMKMDTLASLEDGTQVLLSQEKHLLWEDLTEPRMRAARREINLMGAHAVPVITLCCDAQTYEEAETYINWKLKRKPAAAK